MVRQLLEWRADPTRRCNHSRQSVFDICNNELIRKLLADYSDPIQEFVVVDVVCCTHIYVIF